jgi:hypothetical protein
MIDAFRLVFESLLISILFIIPAVLFDRWLASQGIVRPDNTSIVLCSVVSVLIKQIFFISLSWSLFGIIMAAALTLGVHRGDFEQTIKKGRWWWETKKKNR